MPMAVNSVAILGDAVHADILRKTLSPNCNSHKAIAELAGIHSSLPKCTDRCIRTLAVLFCAMIRRFLCGLTEGIHSSFLRNTRTFRRSSPKRWPVASGAASLCIRLFSCGVHHKSYSHPMALRCNSGKVLLLACSELPALYSPSILHNAFSRKEAETLSSSCTVSSREPSCLFLSPCDEMPPCILRSELYSSSKSVFCRIRRTDRLLAF